jgi:hypothetical protein
MAGLPLNSPAVLSFLKDSVREIADRVDHRAQLARIAPHRRTRSDVRKITTRREDRAGHPSLGGPLLASIVGETDRDQRRQATGIAEAAGIEAKKAPSEGP